MLCKSILNNKKEDYSFIASNINSLMKKNYGYKTCYEMFKEEFGKSILNKLHIEKIEKEDVCLLNIFSKKLIKLNHKIY